MNQSKKSRLFLIVLLAITLIAPSIPQVQADSDTWQIGESSDDCVRYGATGWSLTMTTQYIGHSSFTMISGIRWIGINIPQGATINSAFIEIYPQRINTFEVIVQGFDEDNTTTFSTYSDYDARPLTTASVTWEKISPLVDTWLNSTDIASVIQEIIDRGTWVSGNALGLQLLDTNKYTGAQYFDSYDKMPSDSAKLHVNWTPPIEDFIDNSGIEASDITPEDKQWFFLNASIEIQTDTSTFLFNRIDIDPDGLNMSCSYTNITDTFVEENDPNNYLQLDISTSIKTDVNSTNIRIDYYIMFHHNVTKDGAYDVKVYSTASGGLNDTDTFNNVFTLTIREPLSPTELFGSGFNATSPYVELHWNHSLVNTQFFEIQNSTDAESWIYLGQSTTANYTDTQVVNGTKRYYKVRACFQMDDVWSNSSWSDMNFEKVHFIQGDGVPVDDYSIVFLAIGLILMLSIAFLYAKNR